jgi:pyridinium-3,5-bisthiocarboxylic acid mononucleotide nickel chelatase
VTKILYIDPMAGCSGDMFLGALVDLGVSFDNLREQLLGLGVPGFDLRQSAVTRHQIAATKVDVAVEDVPHPHRHLRHLVEIIEKSNVGESVKARSIAALTRLAEAEARVHRMPIEKVHLHEVGGLDCLVDVVGSMIAFAELGVEAIYSGPVSDGAGFQKCAHGTMPVPVPGSLAILEGFPIRRTEFPFEMTTPTGAAILREVAKPAPSPFTFTPLRTGYGAGTRDPREVANLLRIIVGEVARLPLPAAHTADSPHSHGHSHDHHHDHSHTH